MKKFFKLLMAVMLVLCMTACGQQSSETPAEEPPVEEAPPATWNDAPDVNTEPELPVVPDTEEDYAGEDGPEEEFSEETALLDEAPDEDGDAESPGGKIDLVKP